MPDPLQKVPAEHKRQVLAIVAPTVVEYWPPKQCMQPEAAGMPTPEHKVDTVLPVTEAYLPASHGVQISNWPTTLGKVPKRQSAQEELPELGLYVPAEHAEQ